MPRFNLLILLLAYSFWDHNLLSHQSTMLFTKSILPVCALLTFTATAAPTLDGRDGHDSDCLTEKDAKYLVDTLQYFYVKLDQKLAEKTLTEDFISQSDTQNAVFGCFGPGVRVAFLIKPRMLID